MRRFFLPAFFIIVAAFVFFYDWDGDSSSFLGQAGGGTHVATVEVPVPNHDPFLLQATIPIPTGVFRFSDEQSGISPFSVIDTNGQTVSAQATGVARAANGDYDVVEISAPVSRGGNSPGTRVQYRVVATSNSYAPWPTAGATVKGLIGSGPSSIPQNVKTLINQGLTIRAFDPFGNEYRADITTQSLGTQKVFKNGNRIIQARTYNSLLPLPGTPPGSTQNPGGALPHLMGVHAYFTARENDPVLQLDLRVSNAASGLQPQTSDNDALAKLYFDTVELLVPQGTAMQYFLNHPSIGASYTEGAFTVYPIIKPEPNGKMNVMPERSFLTYRLALSPLAETARAREILDLKNLGFAIRGQSTSAGFGELYSWENPATAAYFPQKIYLPNWNYMTGSPGGHQGLRDWLTNEWNTYKTNFENGNIYGEMVNGDLGPWTPWGNLYAGVTSGNEIDLTAGHVELIVGSQEGVRLRMLNSRSAYDRVSNALYRGDGDPLRYEDAIVHSASGDAVPVYFYGDFDTSSVACRGLGMPGNNCDPFGFNQAPQYQNSKVATDNLAPGYEGTLFNYQDTDSQHYIRLTRNPMALTWISNDALSKDDIARESEVAQFITGTLPMGFTSNPVYMNGCSVACASAGKGITGWGRGRWHPTQVFTAGYAVSKDDQWRSSKKNTWFNKLLAVLEPSQIPCSGIIHKTQNKGTDNHYYSSGGNEEAMGTNAMQGIARTVYQGVDPSNTQRWQQILFKNYRRFTIDAADPANSYTYRQSWLAPRFVTIVSDLTPNATPYCSWSEVPTIPVGSNGETAQDYANNNGLSRFEPQYTFAYAIQDHLGDPVLEPFYQKLAFDILSNNNGTTLIQRLQAQLPSPYKIYSYVSGNAGVHLLACAQRGICAWPSAGSVIVSIAPQDATAAEPGTDTGSLVITRTGSVTSALTVNLAISGSATPGADYVSIPTQKIIPVGSVSVPIPVNPLDDTIAEPPENVIVSVIAGSGYNPGSPVSGTVTINDNDGGPMGATVAITADDPNATEAGADRGSFKISRTGSTAASLVVNYTISGTATNGTDYKGTNGQAITSSRTLAAGIADTFITIVPVDDSLAESTESVIITLNGTSNSSVTVDTNAAIVNIADNDGGPPPLPTVSVSVPDPSAAEAGLDPGTIRLTRTGATTAQLTVNFAIAGTATNGTDYQTITTSKIIPIGAAFADVTVTPFDDTSVESSETVIVTVSPNASVYTVGAPNAGTVNITDNDTAPTLPTVTILATDPAAAEAGSGVGVFRVSRTGSTVGALTVTLAISGTATNGVDYQTIGTSKIIPNGSPSATITLTPIDDTLVEGSETAILTIQAAPGVYAVGSPSSETVTITDNDSPPPPLGNARLKRVGSDLLVTSAPAGAQAWVDSGTPQSANPADILNLVAGLHSANATDVPGFTETAGVCMYPIGGTECSISSFQIPPICDGTSCSATMTVFGGEVTKVAFQYVATPPTLPTLDVVVSDSVAMETGLNPGIFRISRTGNTSAPLTVQFTMSGTATNGSDYQTITGTKNIPAGSPSNVVQITPIDDTIVEGDEIVTLTLQNSSAYTIGSSNSGSFTIQDNDVAPPPTPVVTVSVPDASAGEPSDNGTFRITRTGSTASSLAVNVTMSGSATGGFDYQTIVSPQTIPAGALSVDAVVATIDDSQTELTESVLLTLAPGTGYTVGTQSSGTVDIVDNDTTSPSLPTISVSVPDPSAAEAGLDPGTIRLTRTGSTASTLTVNFAVSGTATNGTDYQTITASKVISSGSASADIAVIPIDDSSVESSETVILTLSTNAAAYAVGSANDGTVSILDNDTAPPPPGGGPPPPPSVSQSSVTTSPATGISQTVATMNGVVNPNNSLTSAWFEYGTSPSLGITTSTQSVGSGNSSSAVTFNLQNLIPNTTYYFRVVASNAYGTTQGSILSFATQVSQLQGSVPGVPAGFSALILSPSQVWVSWVNAPDSLRQGYELEVSTNGTTWITKEVLPSNYWYRRITGLNAGTTYSFRIRAYGSAGKSAPSSVGAATTLAQGSQPFTKPLYRGLKDPQVSRLQALLSGNGIIYPQHLVTGYYGILTETAVKRFQAKYGIPQVGIVGPLTRAKLNALMGANAVP